jgi:hypothetical protein
MKVWVFYLSYRDNPEGWKEEILLYECTRAGCSIFVDLAEQLLLLLRQPVSKSNDVLFECLRMDWVTRDPKFATL